MVFKTYLLRIVLAIVALELGYISIVSELVVDLLNWNLQVFYSLYKPNVFCKRRLFVFVTERQREIVNMWITVV